MSHSQVTDYLRPSALDEALALLRSAGKSARFVAGGADVVLSLGKHVTTLIDLCDLGLSKITESVDGIEIGATVTLNQMLENQSVTNVCNGVVKDVLSKVGSPLLRNIATVGGTLVSAHPWSDVIPLLEVLDAKATLYDGQYQTQNISKLYASRSLFANSILTKVVIPNSDGQEYAAFHKFSRTGYDIALLNVACYMQIDGSSCTKARVAVGGTPHLASQIGKVEEALTGNPLNPESIEKASVIAREHTNTANDRRATGQYRKQLVYAGVKRCLHEIMKKLEAGR